MRLPRWVVGASLIAGVVAVRRRKYLGVRPQGPRPEDAVDDGHGEPHVSPQALEIDLPAAEEGAIHLMMSDGSVVEASEDLDPDGRLRYLADNLLGPGDSKD